MKLQLAGLVVAVGQIGLLAQPRLSLGADERSGPLCDNGNIWSVAVSAASGEIIAAMGRYGRSRDGRLSLYDARSGRHITSIRWPKSRILAGCFSSNGADLATSDEAGRIAIWHLGESRGIRPEALKPVPVCEIPHRALDLCFGPDDSLLALACDDYVVRLLDVITGQVVQELTGHTDSVSAVAFSPDGQRLASAGGDDGTIRVWNLADADEATPLTLQHGEASVTDLTFSPSGKWVVGSYGNSDRPAYMQPVAMKHPKEQIRLWDIATGRLIRTFHVAGDRLTSVMFSPDGKKLVVGYTYEKCLGGTDNSVAVIDVESGQRRCTLRGRWSSPTACCCAVTGHIMVKDGRNISRWDITQPENPQQLWETRWTRRDKLSRTPAFKEGSK